MKNLTITFIVLTLGLSIVKAMPTDTLSTPKIGLVLSGGAAKGLSHIGVLKVLEEAGITPDYITGTSMGAVVGGLYALGYSADEISEIAESVDWNFLLSDRVPLNKVAFEEKHEYNRYIFGIPVRNYKFKLPSGVIVGQQLEKVFADLMWPLEEEIDFDSLPIPFRCMGVDLLSGAVVEFKSGNLSECIRASMSIPSLFAPESIDSMLFVDGGILRNFPVQEVKKMGADIVIGVYVGFDNKVTKEDMFSMTNVLSRSTVLQGIIDAKEQSKQLDIQIEPELEDLGAGDFTKASRLIELGKQSALKHFTELRELKDSLELSKKHIRKNIVPSKIKISSIQVINDRAFISERFVIARSEIEENDVVTKEILNEAIDNIYGTQYFQKVNYSLEKQQNGTYKLLFKVREYTRAFLNFSAYHINQYGTGINTNLTLRNYLIPETRALVSLNIAKNPNFVIDINKYFGNKQRIMKRSFFEWNLYKNYLYRNGIDIGVYKLNTIKAGIGGKYSISVNHQIGVDGLFEKQKISPRENLKNYFGTESFNDYSFKGFSYKLYYQVNSTDNKFFPKNGIKFDVWYKYFFNTSTSYDINDEDKKIVDDIVLFRNHCKDFNMMYINIEKYFSLYEIVAFNIGISSGISSDESIGMGNFVIGGIHNDRRQHYIPFAGKNFAENIIPNFSLLKAGLNIEVLPDIYLSARFNVCTFANSKSIMFENLKIKNLETIQKGFCAGIQANTIIGPVSLMAGGNDYDNSINWHISLGYPF